jgi:hypothetical protein
MCPEIIDSLSSLSCTGTVEGNQSTETLEPLLRKKSGTSEKGKREVFLGERKEHR